MFVFVCLSVDEVVVVVFDDEKRFDLKTGIEQIFIFDTGTLKGYVPDAIPVLQTSNSSTETSR